MGEANRRGKYAERVQQAIVRQEQERKKFEEYKKAHPVRHNPTTVLPLLATMALLNETPYYPLPYIKR